MHADQNIILLFPGPEKIYRRNHIPYIHKEMLILRNLPENRRFYQNNASILIDISKTPWDPVQTLNKMIFNGEN